ncbi:MAG: hypothetical protein ACMV0K_00100 [Sulfurospirillum sp.]
MTFIQMVVFAGVLMLITALNLKLAIWYIGYIGGLGHQRQKYLDTLVRDIFRI